MLILFIYLPLWIIVSVNQRRLDKGFHAAENSYTATLEGDRQRRLYLSPALISIVWCKLIHSPRIAVTGSKVWRVLHPNKTSDIWHVILQHGQELSLRLLYYSDVTVKMLIKQFHKKIVLIVFELNSLMFVIRWHIRTNMLSYLSYHIMLWYNNYNQRSDKTY